MAHSLDDITRTRLALGTQHSRALAHAPQRLAQIARAANKRHSEAVLVDMISLVGRRQHFGFIDAVNTKGLQNLGLDQSSDPALGPDRNGDGLFNADHQLRVAHAGHATVCANIGGHALQRHHGTGSSLFGNFGLLGVDYITNHSPFEHLWESALNLYCSCLFFHDKWASLANSRMSLFAQSIAFWLVFSYSQVPSIGPAISAYWLVYAFY